MEKTKKEILLNMKPEESFEIKRREKVQTWRHEASYLNKTTNRLYRVLTDRSDLKCITKVWRVK